MNQIGLETPNRAGESRSWRERVPRPATGERLPPPLPTAKRPRKGCLTNRGIDRRSAIWKKIMDCHLAHLPAEQILIDWKEVEIPPGAVKLADPARGMNTAPVGDEENSHYSPRTEEVTSSIHSN